MARCSDHGGDGYRSECDMCLAKELADEQAERDSDLAELEIEKVKIQARLHREAIESAKDLAEQDRTHREELAEKDKRERQQEAERKSRSGTEHCPNPKCGREVSGIWGICPTCGVELQRICPNCQQENFVSWKFCIKCRMDEPTAKAKVAKQEQDARDEMSRQQVETERLREKEEIERRKIEEQKRLEFEKEEARRIENVRKLAEKEARYSRLNNEMRANILEEDKKRLVHFYFEDIENIGGLDGALKEIFKRTTLHLEDYDPNEVRDWFRKWGQEQQKPPSPGRLIGAAVAGVVFLIYLVIQNGRSPHDENRGAPTGIAQAGNGTANSLAMKKAIQTRPKSSISHENRGLNGDWQGSYNFNGSRIGFRARFKMSGKSFSGSIDDIGNNLSAQVHSGTVDDEGKVFFMKRYNVGGPQVSYRGAMVSNGSIAGEWTIDDTSQHDSFEMSRR